MKRLDQTHADESPTPRVDVTSSAVEDCGADSVPAPSSSAPAGTEGNLHMFSAEGRLESTTGDRFDPLPADGYGPDADLVERARTDGEAFGCLYERYVDRIYSYVYHRVGNAQDAEDLTARTFHRALHAIDKYEERGLPFAAWLFRIAHNLVANWHRDRSRRRLLSLDRMWLQRSDQADPEDEYARMETHDALWEAINRLPADRRDLLLYKFSGRMSNIEIGGLLKKSESAIKSLYFRTLASLRKDLEASGWGDEPIDAAAGLDDALEAGMDEPSAADSLPDASLPDLTLSHLPLPDDDLPDAEGDVDPAASDART